MTADNITHDVSVIGPGMWVAIHLLAANAQTPKDVQLFKDYMQFLRDNFPCHTCQAHIGKFMDSHPYSNYTSDFIDGKEIGYFRLSWYLHSAVNERLGKKFFPFQTAYDIYFKTAICMDVCPGIIADQPVSSIQAAVNKKAVKPQKFSLLRLNQ